MAIVNDRIPTQPNRKKITNESTGAVEYATVEYADNPTVVGTPINKALFDKVQFWDVQEEEISKFQEFYMAYIPTESKLECLFCTSQGTLLGVYDNIVCRSEDGGLSWTQITLPSGIHSSNNWTRYSFAEHDGIIVGGSSGGKVVYSNDDGKTWSYVYSGSSYDLVSMCYYNGRWIAGAESGYCVKSSNLKDWTLQKIGGGDILYVFSSDTEIVSFVEDAKSCYTSVDGDNWSSNITVSDAYSPELLVAYFAGQWVAIARNGGSYETTQIYCSTSLDGSKWKTSQILEVDGNKRPSCVIDGNVFFILIGGQIFESTDLTSWDEAANINTSSYLDFSANTIAVANGNRVYLSLGNAVTKNVLFYTLSTIISKSYVKNNEETILGEESVMSCGSYIGTGAPQVIVFDFTPKAIFLSSLFSSLAISRPYSGAMSKGYVPEYLWGENSFVTVTDFITSGTTFHFVALG